MKREDRRVSRTKLTLKEALVDLALDADYDDVSIKDITRRADVGYSTFFRHYKSKDALLLHILKSAYEELKLLLSQESTRFSEAVALYRYANEHPKLFLLVARLPRHNAALEYIWQDCARFIVDRYRHRGNSFIPMNVVVNHLIRSAIEMLRWFVENDQGYSPEEMAAIHLELIVNATEIVALSDNDVRLAAQERPDQKPVFGAAGNAE